MGFWSLRKLAETILAMTGCSRREAENLASWIWQEGFSLASQGDVDLSPADEKKIEEYLIRLSKGEPVQYIVGYAWFYGYKLKVTSDVLIPRPETEELVEWLISEVKPGKQLRILDIGTGSGCIAIALKKKLGQLADIIAIDISEPALVVAMNNANLIEAEITFIKKDFITETLMDLGPFDVIISNPPYISMQTAGTQSLAQLKYEPSIALYPKGDNPDIFYKKLAETAMELLVKGGRCYLELNEFRVTEIMDYFHKNGWKDLEIRQDLQAKPRMLRMAWV